MIQTPSTINGVRHILGLSGGKDSSALAVYLKDRVPQMEYVFCDTEKELQETYDYLAKLEAYLGKPIVRLSNSHGLGFDSLLKVRNGFLPSPQMRWCTDYLKIKPFEKYVGESAVINYVGIRADEQHRKGYISHKPNITSCFPFIEDNIRHADVVRILEDVGLGLPTYYSWRSRSGCFFCFFQQRREWVGLLETHPDLYRQAMEYERTDPVTGERYTWGKGESLEELARPERVAQIKSEFEERQAQSERRHQKNASLLHVLGQDDEDSQSCLICHL